MEEAASTRVESIAITLPVVIPAPPHRGTEPHRMSKTANPKAP